MDKAFYKSKTIQGIVLAAIPVAVQVLAVFGVDVTPDEQQILIDGILGVAGLVGVVLAVIGRVKAKHSLKIK